MSLPKLEPGPSAGKSKTLTSWSLENTYLTEVEFCYFKVDARVSVKEFCLKSADRF